MAAYSGKTGTVTTAGNAILKVTRWSMNRTCDAIEVTGMTDSPHRRFVTGLQGATVSYDAVYDDTGVTGRPPDITTDAVVAWQLETDSGPARTFSGNAVVTGYTYDVDLEGNISYSVEATVDDDVTEV